MNVIKLNRCIVTTCHIFVCIVFLWGGADGLANFTHPAHAAPIAGVEWKDTNSTSHNHNTTIQWNMENIRKQSTPQYDAYGSWYYLEGQAPATMDFHSSGTPSGRDHADAIHFGHGYIPAGRPIKYYYDNVPANNLDVIDMGFEKWQNEINNNTSVFRKPGTHVGFAWEQTTDSAKSDITVRWEDTAGFFGIASWSPGSKVVSFDSTPQMQGSEYWVDTNANNIFDLGVDTLHDHNGNGAWDGSEPYIDNNDNGQWDVGEPYEDWSGNGGYTNNDITIDLTWQIPASGQVDVYELDLFTTGLHELGHAVGLDDLYNLNKAGEGQYPNSLMGIGASEYWLIGGWGYKDPGILGVAPQLPMRSIDVNSIQGGVDLYTIPEPATLILLAMGGLDLIRRKRKE